MDADPRLTDVHADIPALHDLAAAHSRHAAAVDAVSSRLSAAPPPPDAFGPAGAHFLAALRDAIEADVRAASALSERLAGAADTTAATATAFTNADHRVGLGVARGVGM